MKKFLVLVPLLLTACSASIGNATVVCKDGTKYTGYVLYDFDEISVYYKSGKGDVHVIVPRNSCYIQENS